VSHDDETKVIHRGGLSADERLERIEAAVEKMAEKLDEIREGLSDGSTRFATLDMTLTSLTQRVQKLEDGRDLVIKIVMGGVVVALLALIGLKVTP
jgi:predicted nuclease with TOPRIM domain